MFCNKCGNKFVDDAAFCNSCGTARKTDTAQAAPVQAVAPASAVSAAMPLPNPAPVKKSGGKKLIIPVASVLAILLVGVAVFAFIGNPFAANDDRHPLAAAFGSFTDEALERLASSPFQALVILADAVNEGAATFDVTFDYRSGSMWNPDVNGSVTLASDFNTFNHALTGEVRVMGMPVDFRAFLNEERIAFGSNLIGSDNFGVTFSTLSRDLDAFGRTFGIDQWTMWELQSMADMLDTMLGGTAGLADFGDFSSLIAPLENIWDDFLNGLEQVTTQTTVNGVSAERISYRITDRQIFDLLDEFLRALEVDNALDALFASPFGAELAWELGLGSGFGGMNWIIRELRDELRFLQRDVSGHVELAVYVSGAGRMMQASFEMVMDSWGDRIRLWMNLDLGTSVDDLWRLDMGYDDGWWSDSTSMTWDFRNTHRGYENTLRIIDSWDTITFESIWNPDTGNFTLGFDDGWWSDSFSGNFRLHGGGFTFSPERIEDNWSGDTFDFSVTVTPGASVPNVNFINIDRWDAGLLDMIERSILGLLW